MHKNRAHVWFPLLVVLVYLMTPLHHTAALSAPQGDAQSDGPDVDAMEATFVELTLWKFSFTSGLRKSQSGRPDGKGADIVYVADPVGCGSGFVVREDGTIVTNYHIVRRCSRIEAAFPSGRRFPVDSITIYDPTNDLALAKLTATERFAAVELDDSDMTKMTDEVWAVGNSRCRGISVSHGRINRIQKGDNGERVFLEHDAAIGPGNSGGPLYRDGRVVGINTGTWAYFEFYFAKPANQLRPLLAAPVTPKLLNEWFPSDAEAIMNKTILIGSSTGRIAGADVKPVSWPVNVSLASGLIDLAIVLEAEAGADLALSVQNEEEQRIGFSDERGSNMERLFLSIDHAQSIDILVVNTDRTPARFGLSVYRILW